MTVRDRAVWALGALAALQLLHLLDELRTDEATDLAGLLLRPQPIVGIGGAVVALVLVRRGNPLGRTLALWLASIVALGFLLSHGIPVESSRTKPYWGDGSADVVQWLGVSLVWAACAAVIATSRTIPRNAATSGDASRSRQASAIRSGSTSEIGTQTKSGRA
jgi:hypothetical protein